MHIHGVCSFLGSFLVEFVSLLRGVNAHAVLATRTDWCRLSPPTTASDMPSP
jgi:hypothetical protein